MPSDNSCLFTAFGGALPEQIAAQRLRQMMADYIMAHSDVYTEAVLGCSPGSYCHGIQDPERWGGGIELSILSTVFDLQICTYDVQVRDCVEFSLCPLHKLTVHQDGKTHHLRRIKTTAMYPGLLGDPLRPRRLFLL